MSRKIRFWLALCLGVAVIAAVLAALVYRQWRADPFTGADPLTANAAVAGRIGLIDTGFSLDALPPGWALKTFFNVKPTDYQFTSIDDRFALHCATNDSASILARNTAVSLVDFPTLAWSWKIDKPLESAVDEATRAGDDHPARLFLRFQSQDGTKTAAEIIWSNKKYKPGDYKIIDGFHHLVANGGDANAGVWHEQSVGLQALYRAASGRDDAPMLTVLGFFCDSDNTGASTSAYFSGVALDRASPALPS